MKPYPKIDSVFKRDDKGRFIRNECSRPEFDYLYHNEWIWTEKVDGTNVRVGYSGEDIVEYGGRTDNAQIPTFLLIKLREVFEHPRRLHDVALMFDGKVTFYGEGYGAKIQKGGQYIPDGVDFILFDVLVGDWWLKREDVEDIAMKLELSIVPVVLKGSIYDAIRTIQSDTFTSRWPGAHPEGLVGKPAVEVQARNGDRIVTKLKVKDFA